MNGKSDNGCTTIPRLYLADHLAGDVIYITSNPILEGGHVYVLCLYMHGFIAIYFVANTKTYSTKSNKKHV